MDRYVEIHGSTQNFISVEKFRNYDISLFWIVCFYSYRYLYSWRFMGNNTSLATKISKNITSKVVLWYVHWNRVFPPWAWIAPCGKSDDTQRNGFEWWENGVVVMALLTPRILKQGVDSKNDVITTCKLAPLEQKEVTMANFAFHLRLKQSRSRTTFSPLTKEELKEFLGINKLMDIKKLPSMRDYWSSNDELRDPYISSKMCRNSKL